MRSAIYTGTLVHARRSPARHVFRYPVSYWLFDLDELSQLERRLRLFSVNRPNVVSLRDVDHFDGAAPLKEAVIELAADPSIERVLMLTQPRVLGYVFNPVSFYWCYRADGSLGCMVSELNNTFGERLPEVLRGPELRYEQRKRLHVSPFFGLDQTYEYAFSQPGDDVWARIHVREGGPLVVVEPPFDELVLAEGYWFAADRLSDPAHRWLFSRLDAVREELAAGA